MSTCDRCPSNDVDKRGVFGYSYLCVDCFCVLLYGRDNNDDPNEYTLDNNTVLDNFRSDTK